MSYFVSRLPDDLVGVIREFVLSVDIKLSLLYQKYTIDEKFIKKMLKGFNSKQLESINWKYLYYKIFKVSPPRCDNRNLAAIFDDIEEEYPSYYDYVRTNGDISYSEPKYKLCNKSVKGFWLTSAITRSDYYSENVHTEMGRKRQQNYNIVRGWYYIKNGRWSSDLDEFNWYMCNVEYELLRVLMILSPDVVAKKKRTNRSIKS